MARCNLRDNITVSEKHARPSSFLYFEDEVSSFLRYPIKYLPDKKTSHSKGHKSTRLPREELKIWKLWCSGLFRCTGKSSNVHTCLHRSPNTLSHRSQLELSNLWGLSYILSAIWKSVLRVIRLHFFLNILTLLWYGSVLSYNYLFDLVCTVLMLLIFVA